MLILHERAVMRALDLDALIPAVSEALQALAAGVAVQPQRTVLSLPDGRGFLWTMPGAHGGFAGAKLVTYVPETRAAHTHYATIVLFDAQSGEPVATMDARYITALRTAAVSAAATQALARPDASILAILGAGTQAASHLDAIRRVRSVGEVRVWSPNRAAAFAQQHDITQTRSAEEAVRGADIVVVATSSHTPVLRGEWLDDGTHVNAVGAPRPDWRELDDDVLVRARLFVESRTAAEEESGDVRAAPARGTEVGDVLAGRVEGRRSPSEVTLFKSVGVAVADIAAAALVYAAARHGNV